MSEPRPITTPQHRTGVIAAWCALVVVVLAATWAGHQIRRWTWDVTEKAHYAPDMRNAYQWGSRAADEGYLEVYENVVARHPGRDFGLDYVPLRLLVMTQWVKWTRKHHSDQAQWTADYAFNRPLLAFNTVAEWTAAALAFGIVRLWVRRSRGPRPPPWTVTDRGTLLGLVAALLVWFNPAMIVSAHGRPTWDVWVVPFYLGAVLLASSDRWFTAGVAVAVGAMFKGQQMLVLPALLLWPIFAGRWTGAARLAGGFAVGLSLVALPWLVSYRTAPADASTRVIDWWAVAWLGIVVAVPVALVRVGDRWPMMPWHVAASLLLLGVTLLCLPFIATHDVRWIVLGLAVAVGVVALAWTLGDYVLPHLAATSFGIAALLCIPLFHGSGAWWDVPIRYGAEKMPQLEIGGAFSMAAILQNVYGWRSHSPVFELPDALVPAAWEPYAIDMRTLLWAAFALTLILCAVGLAMHDRRRDARFLAAVVAPWACYFAIAPLMHERYLLWAAVASAVCVGTNWGLAWLGVLLSVASWCMSMLQMLSNSPRLGGEGWPGLGRELYGWLHPLYPHAGWMILLAAGVYLYFALAPTRRSRDAVAPLPVATEAPPAPVAPLSVPA